MESVGKKVVELNIEDVLPNRFQPRIKFNEEAINELSKSIKEHGVIQPIVVRPIGDKYEIIAGERRYKASCMAELKTIPAIITDLNDKDSAEVALIENVQRENLTPIEEAISYKKILDMGYITQDALATKLGKTQSTVANKLRLLNLDDEVQEALLNEKISERHARSLLKLTDKQEQKQMLNKIISERLTVRRADEEIEKILSNTPSTPNIDSAIPVDKEQKKVFIDIPLDTTQSQSAPAQPTENPEPGKFKFINTFNEEPKEEKMEEEKMEEIIDNNEEAQEELKPKKFFNILNNDEAPAEETVEEEKPEKTEESPINFNNMFVNNDSKEHMNPMLKELTEIENSINNSNSLPPIFQGTVPGEQSQEENNKPVEQSQEENNKPVEQQEEPPKKPNLIDVPQEEQPAKPNLLDIPQKENNSDSTEEIEEFDDFDDDMDFIEEDEPTTIGEKRITNFKDVLEEIRNCSGKIEKAGYEVELEEYDLDQAYQVIFKIKK